MMQNGFGLIVGRVAGGQEPGAESVGRFAEEAVSGGSGRRFQSLAGRLGSEFGVGVADVAGDLQLPAKLADEGFVLVRFCSAEAVIEMGGDYGSGARPPDFEQKS
jgi:hypothetical protein